MYIPRVYIKKNNFVTTPNKNDKGVKQVLLYLKKNLNDLGKCFDDRNKSYPLDLGNHKINHLLFSDDLLLLSENKGGLQHCLNKLNSYCITWRLQINLKKTKIMIFSKGKKRLFKISLFSK